MNKELFLNQLAVELGGLSKEEQEDALIYYTEYFNDSPKSEEEIIADLGTPSKVAKQLITESRVNQIDQMEPSAKKGVSAVWAVVLAIFAIPIGIPILIGVAAVVFSILVAAFSVVLSLFLSGIACLVAGIIAVLYSVIVFAAHFSSGLAFLGTALASVGIGALLIIAMTAVGKLLINGTMRLAKSIVRRAKK